MANGAEDPSIKVLGTDLAWDVAAGTCSSAGMCSAMFWLDPSLLWMLAPMADELGVPLFRLIAYNANLGAVRSAGSGRTSRRCSRSRGWGSARAACTPTCRRRWRPCVDA
jgi:hypothetical protein